MVDTPKDTVAATASKDFVDVRNAVETAASKDFVAARNAAEATANTDFLAARNAAETAVATEASKFPLGAFVTIIVLGLLTIGLVVHFIL